MPVDLDKLIQFVSDYGISNSDAIVTASFQPFRPTLPRCLAMIENESGGRNIFGGEGEACPVAWYEGEVTQARYTTYKLRRNKGYSPNGVGPTQITDPSLQVAAEKKGGCWIPLHNCEIGFGFLHGLIEGHRGDVFEGARSYNGSGLAAEAYAERFVERAGIWEARLRKFTQSIVKDIK